MFHVFLWNNSGFQKGTRKSRDETKHDSSTMVNLFLSTRPLCYGRSLRILDAASVDDDGRQEDRSARTVVNDRAF